MLSAPKDNHLFKADVTTTLEKSMKQEAKLLRCSKWKAIPVTNDKTRTFYSPKSPACAGLLQITLESSSGPDCPGPTSCVKALCSAWR